MRTRARIRAAGVVVAAGWLAGCADGTMGPAPIPPPPPPPPPNHPPEASSTLPSATLVVGDTLAFAVSNFFRDPDGDSLAYTAETTQAGVAEATVAGDRVTLIGVAPGSIALTVTARDPGGLSAAD
ncbi:hypothetical protein [Candidatus Palauibacter sp.]|uniref:hypothetical protein n=1 Tax=Candidatus Palauibacter sp. TaxID=3101350 RepID=UPI003B52FABE